MTDALLHESSSDHREKHGFPSIIQTNNNRKSQELIIYILNQDIIIIIVFETN